MMESSLWQRYQSMLCQPAGLGLRLDLSRMAFPADFFERLETRMQQALAAMKHLEEGAIANPDEGRQVGHYWLRAPELAPSVQHRREIGDALAQVQQIASDVHAERLKPPGGARFEQLLVVGIGGSALGPQFIRAALGTANDKLDLFFFDNTDPDGFDLVLSRLVGRLQTTLVLVISKSGGTKETRNGMLEVEAAYARAGLDLAHHAIAITGHGSELDHYAQDWLARVPMFDYVGGRTSVFSAVGLLPAALQGIDIEEFLAGAADMDEVTRSTVTRDNPATLLALAWFHATGGRGARDMVVLPYKDRLELFSKYLQQLVMESLGKRLDRQGREVLQGISVYGNKGSTDQHAYVQQLRDGINNFFVTFIEVLKDRDGDSIEVEDGVTSGDYLHGFLRGTREALWESGRESLTITVPDVSPRTVGMLIALFERAVGLYAELVDINAYHQPGVEAGKKAAGEVLRLQHRLVGLMGESGGKALTAEAWAKLLEASDQTEMVWHLLEHLAVNNPEIVASDDASPATRTFRFGG